MLEESLPLFLALLVSHLLGDFVVQSDQMVTQKGEKQLGAYAVHSTFHLLLAVVSVIVFMPRLLTPPLFAMLVVLVAVHSGVDYANDRSATRWPKARPLIFVVDQLVHLLTILLLLIFFSGAVPDWLETAGAWVQQSRVEILTVLATYLATVFGGSYMVDLLLPGPTTDDETESTLKTNDELRRGGKYIGWVERFIVVSAVVAGSLEAVGLVLTAKSIVAALRLKGADPRVGDYFLLGTLISLSIALTGGLLLLWFFTGTLLPTTL